MAEEGYNGYTNYETWLVCLNIDNDKALYDDVRNIALGYSEKHDNYDTGCQIRIHLELTYWVLEYNIYKICDSWTERDWKEINWTEVAETRLEE